MHDPIRKKLEAYLENAAEPGRRSGDGEFQEHLSGCRECAGDVTRMAEQAMLVRSLRQPDAEPAPGFYARVLERIETQSGERSIWTTLVETAFGRRLALASATAALVMAGYIVSTEPRDGAAILDNRSSIVSPQPDQDRDAVLVNLASFRE